MTNASKALLGLSPRSWLYALCMGAAIVAAPACASDESADDSAEDDITAQKVNGGSTGAFLRQVSTGGFTRIESTITLPDYRTRDNPTPWIYYGLDDGSIDVEVGFAFQQGTVDQSLPRRYRAYIRRGKNFWFADEANRVLPGGTVKLAADYSNGKVYVEQNDVRIPMRAADGSTINGLAVAYDKSELHVRRVVGLARTNDDYRGQKLPTLGPTVFVDTKIRSTDGKTYPFTGDRANWARKSSSGIRYGTIAWPESGVTRKVSGTQETVTLF